MPIEAEGQTQGANDPKKETLGKLIRYLRIYVHVWHSLALSDLYATACHRRDLLQAARPEKGLGPARCSYGYSHELGAKDAAFGVEPCKWVSAL